MIAYACTYTGTKRYALNGKILLEDDICLYAI